MKVGALEEDRRHDTESLALVSSRVVSLVLASSLVASLDLPHLTDFRVAELEASKIESKFLTRMPVNWRNKCTRTL